MASTLKCAKLCERPSYYKVYFMQHYYNASQLFEGALKNQDSLRSDFGGFPDKAAHCASFLKTCFIELL